MKVYRVTYLIIEDLEAEDEEDAFQGFLLLLKDTEDEPTKRDLVITEIKGEAKC